MKYKILEELKEIKSLINQNNNKGYMDMIQIVDYTSLSGSTIRRAINKGNLKVSRKTGKLLFNIEDVTRWLND